MKTLVAWLMAVGLLVSGCGNQRSATEQRFGVAFNVKNDDGEPLEGVALGTGEQEFGVTTETGRLLVRLKGKEGQTVPVNVACPDGYVGPESPGVLRLAVARRVGEEGAQAISFEVVCTRMERQVVLIVHAERGAGVPVRVAGLERGVTDENGNAHVLLTLSKDTRSLDVTLDTSEQAELKPQNPSRVFELAGRDTVLVFDHEFVPPKKPRRSLRRPSVPKRHVPYRVD